jgi:antitoxin VapB
MATAKLFRHGGSQAVRLPKAFRLAGTEVEIERRGDEVILRPKRRPRLRTLAEVARYMRRSFPGAAEFPDRDQPRDSQVRDLRLGEGRR